MIQEQVFYKNSVICYERFGSGQEYIIALHGYGQAAHRWEIITPYLSKRFTLLAFDLPFHGNTKWEKKEHFTPQALLDIIYEILPSSIVQFSLLGYSIGGRIALSLLQLEPQKIKKIVLLAPDGLHQNKWHRSATHTAIGRRMFYNTMKNPVLVFRFAQQLKKRGIINDTYFNMAQQYMMNEPTRMQLYDRWIMTRDFKLNLASLQRKIRQYHIPLDMVFAKHDRIMTANHGFNFIKGLEKQAHVHLIDAGHSFIYPPHAQYIASFFDEAK